jgi:hypothetical protein
MICSAVGTWLITELNLAKNKVATSNSPAANRACTFSEICAAWAKPTFLTSRKLIVSMMLLGY